MGKCKVCRILKNMNFCFPVSAETWQCVWSPFPVHNKLLSFENLAFVNTFQFEMIRFWNNSRRTILIGAVSIFLWFCRTWATFASGKPFTSWHFAATMADLHTRGNQNSRYIFYIILGKRGRMREWVRKKECLRIGETRTDFDAMELQVIFFEKKNFISWLSDYDIDEVACKS